MSPPLEVILRRRHAARTGLRVAALLCVGRFLWLMSDAISGVTFPYLSTALMQVLDQGFAIGLWPVVAACVLLFERRLSRWLVPMPAPDHLCQSCGYSLMNLKSPICPECGADIAPPRSRIPPLPR